MAPHELQPAAPDAGPAPTASMPPREVLARILFSCGAGTRAAARAICTCRAFRDACQSLGPDIVASQLIHACQSPAAALSAAYARAGRDDGHVLVAERDMLALVSELAAQGARLVRQPPDSRWYDAAGERGHTSVLRLALDAGEPPANLVPTLRLAAKGGHAGAVRLLLERLAAAGVRHDPADGGVPWYEAAAERGHTAVLELALAAGTPPASMARALLLASQRGRLKAARLLLDVGAPARDPKGVAWFEAAAAHGQTALVELALQRGVPASSMGHALSLAGGAGKAAVVRLLLEAGAPVDARNNSGRVWYLHAADAASVQLALEHGAPPASLTSALEDAVRLGRADVVRALLHGGVPLPSSEACFSTAAWAGHTAVLEALLDSGAVAPERLQAALQQAEERGHVATVRMLHARGVQQADATGRAWYEAAASRGQAALLELALSSGISAERMSGALQLALTHMHAGAVSLLLERGVPAPPTPDAEWCEHAAEGGHTALLQLAIDSLGVPPASLAGALRVAIVKCHVDTARLLLERGVPTHEAANIGWSALEGSIRNSRYERPIRKSLLQLALDVGVPPASLSPAVTWAAFFGFADTLRLLLSRGVPSPGPDWLAFAAEAGQEDVLAVAQEFGLAPPEW